MARYWKAVLEDAGHDVIAWAEVGSIHAEDEEICAWARANDRVVLTQDLDFGTILAASGAASPSAVILRSRDSRPSGLSHDLLWVLDSYVFSLGEGALLILDHGRHRLRKLPLER
jgi:predicted nuclease of predicted toxin-antitoxin system